MLISKLRPRRFTSRKTFKISSSQKGMLRNVGRITHFCIPVDNSSSMHSEMIDLLSKMVEVFTELSELIETLQREQLNENEAALEAFEMDLKKCAKKRLTRWKSMMRHLVISMSQKKIIEEIFRRIGGMCGKRNQIRRVLFGERYAPWHRISPPNSSEICWRSAAAIG